MCLSETNKYLLSDVLDVRGWRLYDFGILSENIYLAQVHKDFSHIW